MTGYSQEVKDYASRRLESLADLENATPKQIQDRIEELNGNINFFPSTNAQKIQNQYEDTCTRWEHIGWIQALEWVLRIPDDPNS